MRNKHHSCRSHCHRRHNHGHHDRKDKHSPELAGAIFMCNNNTREECFSRGLLGLPASREPFVRQVKDGMYLFLFDTDDRKMYGVFKATSNGGMNILPHAYISSGSIYPAQVQFKIIRMCKSLKEPEFKPAIWDKYFSDIKFNLDLNFDQVQRLLVLFEPKKDWRVARSITERLDPRSSKDSPFDRCYKCQQLDSTSNMHDTSETIHRHIRNRSPNIEAAVLVTNSEYVNVATPRNINPSLVDRNARRSQPEICHACNTSSYQYPDDLDQEAVLSSSSIHLAQQQGKFGCRIGTGNCTMCTQIEPGMAYNLSLLEKSPCGLHADNHLSVSPSQCVQVYASEPPYPENTVRVSTSSNLYDRLQLQDHVCNGRLRLKDVKQRKSVFLRLTQNPRRTASGGTEEVPDSAVVGDGTNGTKVDPTIPVSNSTAESGETHLRLVTFKRRNGGSKVSIELKGAKKRRKLIRNQNMDTEAALDPAVMADGMEVDPTSPISSSTAGPGETEIPFVNFNRRKGGSKLSMEPKGDKKRRLIRPSLELKDEDGCLQVFEGPMHKLDMYFDKPLKNPSLISSKSALNRETMAETGAMDVESQVDGGNSQVLQDSICKSSSVTQTEVELEGVTPQRLQGNYVENKVLLCSIGMEMERGNLELDMNCEAEPSVLGRGQCRHESNERSVSVEMESKKQKQDFEESPESLLKSNICLEKLPEKSNAEPGHEAVSNYDRPQMILVSGSEELNTSGSVAKSLNKTSANFFEGQTELLELGEKTEKKKLVSSPEPIALEPINEIKDNSVVEPEPKFNLSLDNEKSNPVEEYIALEPQSDNSKTDLISNKENGSLVGYHFALEPGADKLAMGLFSLCEHSNPVEGYIVLAHNADNLLMCFDSHDENSKAVKYLGTAEDYIPLD